MMKKSKPKVPFKWEKSELKFIRDNYYTMTWNELVKAVEEFKPDITMQALRHQCHRMKLAKQVQIRWSKEDIQYLIDNYKTKGNIEIAEELNKLKRTFRVIDGVKTYRHFTLKHVEKKMNLLGLKRTDEDLSNIIKRNRTIGKGYCWTKENNVYTLGIRRVYDEGEFRTWSLNGRDIIHIKVDGAFVPYHRYVWEQEHGEIPKGHNISFKDGDISNCDIDNLECISNAELGIKIQEPTFVGLVQGGKSTPQCYILVGLEPTSALS